MASLSIEKRQLKNGEFRYKATIIVKKKQAIIHRESKTFKKKEHARTYGKKRLSDIELNGVNSTKTVPLAALLDKFMADKDL